MVLAGAALLCGASVDKSATKTVLIEHFKFKPETVEVNVGQTVTWNNADSYPHTVTAADRKAFDSGPISNRASWTFTARKQGTYDYVCKLHPNMKGKLIVH